MASVNKCIFVGTLGRDPETRYMPSGDAMSNITIACNDSYKDKTTGEKKEICEWINITFFGKLAEIAGQYLKKGSQVYVEGKLTTRKYTDSNGVEKYATSIKADQMQMLGAKPSDAGAQAPRQQAAPQQRQAPAARPAPDFSDMDDAIPFSNPYRGKYSYVV